LGLSTGRIFFPERVVAAENLKREIDQELKALTELRTQREQAAQANLDAILAKGAADREMLAELRAQREAMAQQALVELRLKGEAEARAAQTQTSLLCATPFGVDVVGIVQTLALIGAVVGGVSARNRKMEMDALNEKLRTVNKVLREQSRASSGVTYAPGLTYAPPASPPPAAAPAKVVASPSTTAAETAGGDAAVEATDQVRSALKAGKRMLREEPARPAPAMVQFKKALMLTRASGDRVQERRAIRGLAAAKRLQGDVRGAIADFKEVLNVSKEMQEFTGDSDALGSIADLYTELGELEEAGKYYDMYLIQLQRDDLEDISPSG